MIVVRSVTDLRVIVNKILQDATRPIQILVSPDELITVTDIGKTDEQYSRLVLVALYKRALAQYKESNSRYGTIIDTLPREECTVLIETTITFSNNNAETITLTGKFSNLEDELRELGYKTKGDMILR